MSNVVIFEPRKNRDVEQNIGDFIALCRDKLTVFGADLPFDSLSWDVSETLKVKAKRGRTSIVFSTWESSEGKTVAEPMPEPFGSFAKAYIRYQQGVRPTVSVSLRIPALRALGAALTETGKQLHLSQMDAGDFHRAAQLIKARFSAGTAHGVGNQLQILAGFIDTNHLSVVPLQWRNPHQRPTDRNKIGDEFDTQRQQMLPSPMALDALARAFREVQHPRDVVVASVAAILCSAPDRVNEVLRLPEDCEIKRTREDGTIEYGLRFWPSKGAEPMVKWLIPSMRSVVEDAIARLRDIGAEARKIAAWYEGNPGKLYLRDEWEHLRGQELITVKDAEYVLYAEQFDWKQVHEWCRQNEVKRYKIGKEAAIRFVDVERILLAQLPRGFPLFDASTNRKFSESLCVIPRNLLSDHRRTSACVIDIIDHGDIQRGLCGSGAHPSLFERMGYQEADGTSIQIRTHQFRHYLNTLAQAGGMSQLDIAKWSGRKDIRQNAAYDHVSDRDKLAVLADLRSDSENVRSVPILHKMKLITREQFAQLQATSAHTTDFGYCVHDFAMAPCQLHADCINCNELACIKGDLPHELNIRRTREETRRLLCEAQAAEADQVYGANRWVAHQTMTLSRMDKLCEILDDPSVPEGAVIRLAYVEPASRLQQAAHAREQLMSNTVVNQKRLAANGGGE